MANIQYVQSKGKKKTWRYQIKQGQKNLLSQSGFKTKKEAIQHASTYLESFNRGNIRKDMSMVELVHHYLVVKIYGKKSESTDEKYQRLESKITKEFGELPVNRLKQSEYQVILDKIGETTGYDYLSRINSIIRKSIQFALADKIFIEDFTKNVEVFSRVSKQSADDKFLHSLKDYERVINYLQSKFDYKKSIVSFIEYFLFKTGLRYGELVALKWEDVDFKNGYIKTYRRFNTKMYKFVKPKNDTSVRSVPVSKKDLDILEQLKKAQNQVNIELGLSNTENFLFYHYGLQNGIPNVATINKAMKKMLNELEIEPIITSKGARHTFGSVLLNKGVDIQVVAKLMGHKDTSMLIKIYAHLLEEMRIKEFDEIKKFLN